MKQQVFGTMLLEWQQNKMKYQRKLQKYMKRDVLYCLSPKIKQWEILRLLVSLMKKKKVKIQK